MKPSPSFVNVRNGQALSLEGIVACGIDAFRHAVIDAANEGWRIAALFGAPASAGRGVDLWAVLAEEEEGRLHLRKTTVDRESYPALTPECPQAHWFEREIAEQWGLRPENHPWLKPIRFQKSYRAGHDSSERWENGAVTVGVTDFYRVEGEEIHEVAVGPVHAGVIEPGHFRFQCHGERVLHLEISLGYQHRGVERALLGGPNKRSFHYMETLAGETSIGHATAYCQALESLAHCRVPPRAQVLRGIALELERLANHVGDLGALAGDVGYTYKIVDPSFHNWMGLAMALRDEQISDFPLCNKSFNLSYCGHDL